MARVYYAHSDPAGRLPDEPGSDWRLLKDHLWSVGSRAHDFAEAAGGDENFVEAARWAGLLHDLGKYSDEFQEMLLAVARGEQKKRVEHSGHGAVVALDADAIDVAFAVAAHHAGLTAPRGSRRSLRERVDRVRSHVAPLLKRAAEDAGIGGTPAAIPRTTSTLDLRVRMLLSCLVDADRLDSAGVEDPPRALQAAVLLEHLLANVESTAGRVPSGPVKSTRREVLRACLAAAAWPERLLSLTVPTGGGKTLSSMAFALKRATKRPDLARRVIVVIPYLSIIEQNAGVFRDALGADSVIEHHSGDFSHEYDEDEFLRGYEFRYKLAVENWDAPVVVTTSVRFFESLFSNRPSDLRRFHNIARSVVILDEVQTLPRGQLHPIQAMIRSLAEEWETTFLFCTATQPAFEKSTSTQEKDLRWEPGAVREIIRDPPRLFSQLQRVTLTWPEPRVTSTWEEVAQLLAAEPRGLCIVNLKRHATELYGHLCRLESINSEKAWHLSASMCPRHRLDVLERIRHTLATHGECRVVSTQLVEAGVDLDFPVVFRALGPLDSVAQAAGRCDREGRLTAERGAPGGRVVVFEPAVPRNRDTPPGTYREATQITRTMVGGGQVSIHDPAHVRSYFNRYYDCDQDVDDIESLRRSLRFEDVAQRFKMIKERKRAVLVPYGKGMGLIPELEQRGGLDQQLARRLQSYQVGLYEREFEAARRNGSIREIAPDMDIWLCEASHYDSEVGFRLNVPPDP